MCFIFVRYDMKLFDMTSRRSSSFAESLVFVIFRIRWLEVKVLGRLPTMMLIPCTPRFCACTHPSNRKIILFLSADCLLYSHTLGWDQQGVSGRIRTHTFTREGVSISGRFGKHVFLLLVLLV